MSLFFINIYVLQQETVLSQTSKGINEYTKASVYFLTWDVSLLISLLTNEKLATDIYGHGL